MIIPKKKKQVKENIFFHYCQTACIYRKTHICMTCVKGSLFKLDINILRDV